MDMNFILECDDDVSIIQQYIWALFKKLCCYSNGNLKTCDKNLLFSCVKILCYFHVWRYHVYAWKLNWYLTGVYIPVINRYIVHWPSSVMLVVLVSTECLQRASFATVLSALLNVLWVSTLPFRSSSPSDNLNYCPDTRDHRLLEKVL